MVELVDLDSEAYAKVLAANRLPKETEAEKAARREAMDAATLIATRTPLETAACCVAALELVPPLVAKGNPNALSDLKVGMELLFTAFTGARANLEINLPWLPQAAAAEITEELSPLIAKAEALVAEGRKKSPGCRHKLAPCHIFVGRGVFMITLDVSKELLARIKLPELEVEARAVLPAGEVELSFMPWSQWNMTARPLSSWWRTIISSRPKSSCAWKITSGEQLRPLPKLAE